jgi:site-specific DNA recombinase
MRISMHWLERYVTEQVFATVDDQALTAASTPPPDDTEPDLRAEIAADERRLEPVEDEYDADEITKEEYQRRRRRIRDRMDVNSKSLERALRARTRVAVPTGDAFRDTWSERDNVWKQTVLAAMIEKVVISPHPVGQSTALPRRKGETDDQIATRREIHMASILRHRVSVRWWQ